MSRSIDFNILLNIVMPCQRIEPPFSSLDSALLLIFTLLVCWEGHKRYILLGEKEVDQGPDLLACFFAWSFIVFWGSGVQQSLLLGTTTREALSRMTTTTSALMATMTTTTTTMTGGIVTDICN